MDVYPGNSIRFISHALSIAKDIKQRDLNAKHDSTQLPAQLHKQTAAINGNILRVWTAISDQVVRKLQSGFGVRIAGLGTFTYGMENVGHNCQVLFKRPRMILASYVLKSQTGGGNVSCNLPISHLDINEIAQDAEMEPHVVDGVISEVLQVFAKALVSQERIEFPFPNLGKLHICYQQAKFKFYMDFCLDLNEDVLKADTDLVNMLFEKTDDWNLLKGRMTPLEGHNPTAGHFSVLHVNDARQCTRKILCQSVRPIQQNRPCADTGGIEAVDALSMPPTKPNDSWLSPEVLRNYYAISFRKSSNTINEGVVQLQADSEGQLCVVPAELLFRIGQDFVI